MYIEKCFTQTALYLFTCKKFAIDFLKIVVVVVTETTTLFNDACRTFLSVIILMSDVWL